MSLVTHHQHGTHILYDPARLAQPTAASLPPLGADWFTREAWAARGLVTGSAPGRGESLFLRVDDREWVLRPYLRGGMIARVSRARYVWTGLERTRAFRELRLTHRLRELGLPVPVPVAAVVERQGSTYRAALVTERLDATVALASRLEGAPPALLERVGAVLRRFHDAGLDHVDLNARNLLISVIEKGSNDLPFSDDDKIWLIDFDRCRLRPPGAWRERNLARLKRSLNRFIPTGADAAFDAILNGYYRQGIEAPRSTHD